MHKPLFETDHPYYGPEGSFWASPNQEAPYHQRFDSWKDFEEGESMYDADIDMNWLYRWDWKEWHKEYPEDYPEGKEHSELLFYWMMPRKGIMCTTTIKVTRDDEPAVRAWLQKYADYMATMWDGFDLSPKGVEA